MTLKRRRFLQGLLAVPLLGRLLRTDRWTPGPAEEPEKGEGGATCPKCGWEISESAVFAYKYVVFSRKEDAAGLPCEACWLATDITGIATRDFERGEVVLVYAPKANDPNPGPTKFGEPDVAWSVHYDLAVILQSSKRGEECVARVKGKAWVGLSALGQRAGNWRPALPHRDELRFGQRRVGTYWVEWDGRAHPLKYKGIEIQYSVPDAPPLTATQVTMEQLR